MSLTNSYQNIFLNLGHSTSVCYLSQHAGFCLGSKLSNLVARARQFSGLIERSSIRCDDLEFFSGKCYKYEAPKGACETHIKSLRQPTILCYFDETAAPSTS